MTWCRTYDNTTNHYKIQLCHVYVLYIYLYIHIYMRICVYSLYSILLTHWDYRCLALAKPSIYLCPQLDDAPDNLCRTNRTRTDSHIRQCLNVDGVGQTMQKLRGISAWMLYIQTFKAKSDMRTLRVLVPSLAAHNKVRQGSCSCNTSSMA